jgi:hypothetical protein
MFASADRDFYSSSSGVEEEEERRRGRGGLSRRRVLEDYLLYAEQAQRDNLYGSSTCCLAKPLHNAFHGE